MAKGGVKNMKSQFTDAQFKYPYVTRNQRPRGQDWKERQGDYYRGNRVCSSTDKKKPYIICGGCSYTDHFFQGDYSSYDPVTLIRDDWKYAKWPEVIAHKLGYEKYWNTGISGAGNQRIWNQIQDIMLLEEDMLPEAIFILWSSWDRFDIFNSNLIVLSEIRNNYLINQSDDYYAPSRNADKVDIALGVLKKATWLASIAHSALRTFMQAQDFCERNNIKLIMAHANQPISSNMVKQILFQYAGDINSIEEKEISKRLDQGDVQAIPDAPVRLKQLWREAFCGFPEKAFESPHAFNIDGGLHVGWPYWAQLGGWAFADKWKDWDPETWGRSYVLKPSEPGKQNGDYHPNEKGHEKIAEELFAAYQNVHGLD